MGELILASMLGVAEQIRALFGGRASVDPVDDGVEVTVWATDGRNYAITVDHCGHLIAGTPQLPDMELRLLEEGGFVLRDECPGFIPESLHAEAHEKRETLDFSDISNELCD